VGALARSHISYTPLLVCSKHHRAQQLFFPHCAHQLAHEWQDRRYRIYSPHVLSDQYVHQDQFLSIFPCAVLRNVTAMKGDAKLSRETPGVSDSCTTRRGSSGRCIWNAAAGILDGFRATGGTGSRAVFFFSWPPEDSPPGAKDKAPGEKQMPPAPYVPLAVGASVSA